MDSIVYSFISIFFLFLHMQFPELKAHNGDKLSVFHLSVVLGRTDIVERLLRMGANAETRTRVRMQ